jgi:endonuclease YncB( thermonuclease family)
LPYILLAGSGKLVYVVDGDTVVLETTKGNVTCHMGEIDTPETKVNSKLKKEMRECAFSQEEFLKAGKLAHNKAKSLLKVGTTYNYKVLGYTRNKNPICKLTLPKGLHVEIRPSFDEMMVSRGYALPYVINSTQHQSKLLLKIAKEAKHKKLGLWNEHYDLMQCLVEHRYSLRSLR